ncbi:MAG: C40 family peptidase [Chitinophagaceae bacterium]
MRVLLNLVPFILLACTAPAPADNVPVQDSVPVTATTTAADTVPHTLLPSPDPQHINTGTVNPTDLIAYAKTLQGIPYKYASTDPAQGFDCSGFITYVFNHFNIAVPRSSVDFTNVEREVPLSEAKPGDLVLFTGTDSTIRVVGHMGILTTAANGTYEFIHSTSGKFYGVTITPLSAYYFGRFVKVVRVFPQND